MCLTCGCMHAHKVMGDNVTYEDLKRMADGNGKSVDETLDIVKRTADIDREQHKAEYAHGTCHPVGLGPGADRRAPLLTVGFPVLIN